MYDVNATFFERQAAFLQYEKAQLKNEGRREREAEREKRKNEQAGTQEEGENEGKFGGYLPFKRWEYMRSTRIDANGIMPNPEIVYTEWLKAHKQFETKTQAKGSGNNSTQATTTWQYVGPPNGISTGTGVGRLCFITFDPTTPTTMFVGSPGGGLWKSVNSGANWTVVNDMLPNLGAAHLAIDPTNSNIIFK